MARIALADLGGTATGFLRADRALIWADPGTPIDVDLDAHEEQLRCAQKTASGSARQRGLELALACGGVLLEDEPFAEWALRRRDQLEQARQEARLALARDREITFGPVLEGGESRLRPDAVATMTEAWESCLEHDPACEEAAAALMRLYSAQGLRHLVLRTYERCRRALEDLGLRSSPSLDEVCAGVTAGLAPGRSEGDGPALPVVARPDRVGREERRTVSVLFAQVVAGAKAKGPDPEELREAVGEVLARVITEVEAFGGLVTSLSGTGLQAVFGAPEAHEDDPERAVMSAYRAQSVFVPPDGHEWPALRIGVETGAAVVGPFRAGTRWDYGAVGAVVSEAATIQSLAKPGSVLVGPVTRAATEGIFLWGPTERLAIGTDAEAIVASYVEQPRPKAPARRLRFGGRGPLVGRGAELFLLDAAIKDAESGKGSVVMLVGEPGLGKTRLVHECRRRFMGWAGARSGRLPLWLEGRSASYTSTTPYGLYQNVLAGWLGLAPSHDETTVETLKKALTVVMGDEDLWPVLATMMGFSVRARLVPSSPQMLQRAIFAATSAVVSRLSSLGPMVLALEDLHWADPTSLSLTRELSSLASTRPLLVLLTRRPEPDPGFSLLEAALTTNLGSSFRAVELAPLSVCAQGELVRSLVGEAASHDVLEAVSTGVEGNPLFLEERFFSMLETRALVKDDGTWRLDRTVDTGVPEVLERVVRSRVDRLSPGAQEAARAAAILGTEFPFSLLHSVSNEQEVLQLALAELLSTGLMQEVIRGPDRSYRFRHAVIQEATYAGLLRAERRRLHGRAAQALEVAFADRVEDGAGVLARHFAAAGNAERAAALFEVAGDHATRVYANSEAVSSFRSALVIRREQLSGTPIAAGAEAAVRAKLAEVFWRTARRDEAREELEEAIRLVGVSDPGLGAYLWIRLGRVEVAARSNDAAETAFDAAEALLGDHAWENDEVVADRWLELMLDGRASLYVQRSEPERALGVLQLAGPVVEARGRPERKAHFYDKLAHVRFAQNRCRVDEEVLANIRLGVAAAEQTGDDSNIAWMTQSLGSFLVLHGDLDRAQQYLESSLALAERIGDALLRAWCLRTLTVAALRRHEVDAVRSLAPRALAACEADAYPTDAAAAKAALAWLAWQDGRPDDVAALANEATELFRTGIGNQSFSMWLTSWPLIAVHLRTGAVSEAVAAADRMLDPSQQRLPDDLEYTLEAARAAWKADDPETAKGKLAEALALAHRLCYF